MPRTSTEQVEDSESEDNSEEEDEHEIEIESESESSDSASSEEEESQQTQDSEDESSKEEQQMSLPVKKPKSKAAPPKQVRSSPQNNAERDALLVATTRRLIQEPQTPTQPQRVPQAEVRLVDKRKRASTSADKPEKRRKK